MKLSSFTIIPPLERYPWLVEFSQSLMGKSVLLLVFAAQLMLLHDKSWWLDMTLIIAIITVLPQHRRLLVLLGTLYWLLNHTAFHWHIVDQVLQKFHLIEVIQRDMIQPASLIMVMLFCAGFYYLAVRFQHTALMHRPVRSMFIVYFSLLIIASYFPLPENVNAWLWFFLIFFGRYFWFFGFSLINIRSRDKDGTVMQAGSYLPFWLGDSMNPVPMPNAAAHLRRIEAKNPEQFAIAQLKGIKLLLWAYVLIIIETLFVNIVFNEPGFFKDKFITEFTFALPALYKTFYAAIEGNYYPWYQSWISLVGQLFYKVLDVAIWGHIIIGCCRMAGYNALRSTYKPLTSSNIAEFWGRYFYYFKELLAEFFYYPTYTRYFKKYPRFRMFFATLVAAGFGNVIAHFVRDIQYTIDMGFFEALWAFHVYMFYGLVLGSAIGISQVRNHNRRHELPWWRKRVTGPMVVILFYCFVLIFNDPDRSLTIKDNFVFVFSLFGIHM